MIDCNSLPTIRITYLSIKSEIIGTVIISCFKNIHWSIIYLLRWLVIERKNKPHCHSMVK